MSQCTPILRHFSASHSLLLLLRFQLQCRALINGSAKIGKVNLDREEEDSELTDNRFTLDDCLVDHSLISSSKHTERVSTLGHIIYISVEECSAVQCLCSPARTWSVRYHRCPLSSLPPPSVLLSLLAIATTTTSTSVPFHLRPAEQREVLAK